MPRPPVSELSFGDEREGAARYLQALREHWLLVLTVVAAAVGVAILYSATAQKRFEARTDVLVTPVSSSDPTFVGIGLLRESSDQSRSVLTAARLVSTPEVAERVRRRLGRPVNRKRVQRLMRVMGLECLFPRPRCTVTSRYHKTYPYLLKGVTIDRPVQVWSADITYVSMPWFMDLVATIDWFSRLVVSWRLSNTLEGSFCQAMLEESLTRGCPAIFNTDQGVQFTATAWTSRLEAAGIQVSMDGVGRCHDNIFVERLWRSVCPFRQNPSCVGW